MRALRRSIKGDKGENRPQHVSISPKSDFAINAPIKVIIAKESFNPNTTTRSPFTTMSAEQISKFVAFEKDEYFHVTRLPNQGENYYEAWTNDHGNYRRGLVPIDKFDEVAKQRRSAGSSAMGTPSLPDSGYSTARSHGRSESGMTPSTPRHARQSSITRGAMVYGVVQYDFNAERPDELEAKAGEAIIVIAQSNPEWFVAKPIGRLGGPGLIPVSFIEIKDMATGLPVPDPHKAVQAAGVPKVEEWKKLAAEYKNSSISLGQLSIPGAGGGQAGANGLSQQMAISPGGQQGGGAQTPQSAQYSQQQQMPPPQQPQSSQRRLLAPVSASIPRYCFENDKYWYIIECVMEDGSHWELSRFYQNFYDFQIKLLQQFPAEAATQGGTRILPFMPGPVTYVTDAISNGRRESLDDYVKRLIELPHYISRCQLVRELFAPREGDFELDPKAMQEDYRLSSTSQNSDSMRNSQTLSREPSNHPYDSNPYSTQARSNPWQGNQNDSVYPGYSTNSSQSNQNLHESNYGNHNGSNSGFHGGSSAQDVRVKVWFEDDCMALKAAADTTFDELETRVKERLKKGPLKHLDPKKYFSIDIHYKSNTGTQPLNDDNDLRRAIATVEGTDHSLQLYVSSYD